MIDPTAPPPTASSSVLAAARDAVADARRDGCTCRPFVAVEAIRPGLLHALLFHDGWCGLMRARDEVAN